MSVSIIFSVIIGILAGYLFKEQELISYSDYFIDFGLCVLLLLVGIDIGKNKDVLKKIKEIGFNFLLVPLLIIIGSIIGSALGGAIVGLSFNESSAVGAGLGWYTLSSMLLIDYSSELSAIAFTSNVIREIIAIISVPIIAKYIGYIESIAPCGATAMDTSLPIISKSTDTITTVIAFITGIILSFSVPILVPILISL